MEATFIVNNMEKFMKECEDKIPFTEKGEITTMLNDIKAE